MGQKCGVRAADLAMTVLCDGSIYLRAIYYFVKKRASETETRFVSAYASKTVTKQLRLWDAEKNSRLRKTEPRNCARPLGAGGATQI